MEAFRPAVLTRGSELTTLPFVRDILSVQYLDFCALEGALCGNVKVGRYLESRLAIKRFYYHLCALWSVVRFAVPVWCLLASVVASLEHALPRANRVI